MAENNRTCGRLTPIQMYRPFSERRAPLGLTLGLLLIVIIRLRVRLTFLVKTLHEKMRPRGLPTASLLIASGPWWQRFGDLEPKWRLTVERGRSTF